MSSKTLVACFSCSGVTRQVAAKLAKVAQADLFEIIPEVPYSNADLNWNNAHSRSSVEMKDKTSRPAISTKVNDMGSYDTVFVGFPIWWYVAPTIINTFLESYDFSGKTIILFATSGGSGFGRTVENLKNSVSPTAIIQEGKLLNGNPSETDLTNWIKNLKLEN
ncbi:MAG: flavodoxin [Planctomycetia bacterium]|nr:flavodoxin [Planctomycetia bacterium]